MAAAACVLCVAAAQPHSWHSVWLKSHCLLLFAAFLIVEAEKPHWWPSPCKVVQCLHVGLRLAPSCRQKLTPESIKHETVSPSGVMWCWDYFRITFFLSRPTNHTVRFHQLCCTHHSPHAVLGLHGLRLQAAARSFTPLCGPWTHTSTHFVNTSRGDRGQRGSEVPWCWRSGRIILTADHCFSVTGASHRPDSTKEWQESIIWSAIIGRSATVTMATTDRRSPLS